MILENIEALCKERGLTVSALERTLGFGTGTIGKWKLSSPSVAKAKAVADFFKVSIDDLLR